MCDGGHEMTEHQRMLLAMLKDFDAVCEKHGIFYQLFAGTALGAVRHQGFIPWDDDVDVILPRTEYERFFREAAGDFDSELYYVQREFSPHWPMHFSKLRRNGTTCIEKMHIRDLKQHQGVYIDIFPWDNLSDNPLAARCQFLASKIVIAKTLYARGYETDSRLKKVFMQVCRILPMAPFYHFCVHAGKEESDRVHIFFGAASKYEKSVFPRSWLTRSKPLPFEDAKFPVSVSCDNLLTVLYGDYRKIPSPKERKCKEHAAILDLEHNYTEHLKEQEAMQIDTYTRSIR